MPRRERRPSPPWPQRRTALRSAPRDGQACAASDGLGHAASRAVFGGRTGANGCNLRDYHGPMARRFTVLVLALSAVGSTACSTTKLGSSVTTTSTTPRTSTSSTGQSAPRSTTISVPVGPMCRNGQIAVSIQTSYVGAGSAARRRTPNVGRSACTLDGYPGVAGLNTRGQQIAQAGRSTAFGGSPADVNVNPGQLAEAMVQGAMELFGRVDTSLVRFSSRRRT